MWSRCCLGLCRQLSPVQSLLTSCSIGCVRSCGAQTENPSVEAGPCATAPSHGGGTMNATKRLEMVLGATTAGQGLHTDYARFSQRHLVFHRVIRRGQTKVLVQLAGAGRGVAPFRSSRLCWPDPNVFPASRARSSNTRIDGLERKFHSIKHAGSSRWSLRPVEETLSKITSRQISDSDRCFAAADSSVHVVLASYQAILALHSLSGSLCGRWHRLCHRSRWSSVFGFLGELGLVAADDPGFFNLVLAWNIVLSAWKSSEVVPVFKHADNCCPIFLASCAFKLFERLFHGRIAPHILPRLDDTKGGFRWRADALV